MEMGKKNFFFFYNEFLLASGINILFVCLFEAFPTQWYGQEPDVHSAAGTAHSGL